MTKAKISAYHHGNLREALLDAAEALLPESGPEGLTLREVARCAGVSHGAPYHHFDSRDTLLAAVAERGFTGLREAMTGAAGATSHERLVAICEAYVEFAASHPTRFRLMFGPLLASKALYPGLKQAGEQSFFVLLDASREVAPAQALPLAHWQAEAWPMAWPTCASTGCSTPCRCPRRRRASWPGNWRAGCCSVRARRAPPIAGSQQGGHQ